MIRAPPRVTLPDNRFADRTLCRCQLRVERAAACLVAGQEVLDLDPVLPVVLLEHPASGEGAQRLAAELFLDVVGSIGVDHRERPHLHLVRPAWMPCPNPVDARSEERRVGKECVSTCRPRWSPYH